MTSSGFKSRVKFFSVLNPTSIVTYTSEVLDAGLLGPLFKVSHLLCSYNFMFPDYFHSSVFLEMSKAWRFRLCVSGFMLKCSGGTEISLVFLYAYSFMLVKKREICSAEPIIFSI